MIPTVNFWQNKTQDILNTPITSNNTPSMAVSKSAFFDWVKKMKQAEWLSDTEALKRGLEHFKNKGQQIEGIDIDSQLTKYQNKLIEEQDTWIGTKIAEQFKGGLSRIWDAAEGITSGKHTLAEGLARGVAGTFETVLSPIGWAIQEGIEELVPQDFKDYIGAKVSPTIEDATEWYNSQSPEQQKNLANIWVGAEVLANFVGAKWLAVAWKWTQTATSTIKQWLQEGMEQGAKQVAKAGWKVVDTVADASTNAAKGTFWQVYKLNQETIEQAFKDPKLFSAAQKVWADDYIRETADNVVKAVKTRADDLSELGAEYASIRKGVAVADDVEVGSILQKNIALVPEKQLTKADKTVIKDLTGYMEWYKGKLTDEDILSLRKQLDSVKFDPTTWLERKLSPQGNRIASAMRKDVDNIAKERITGLRELDAKFAPEIAEVNKLKSIIFDRKWELKDRYIADISNLMWKGKELKIERIRKIIPDIDEKLNMYRALKDVDNAVQGFKVGAYAGGAGLPVAWAVGWLVGWVPWALVWAVVYQMVSNPKLGIEIVKKLAMAVDMKNSIVKSMKAGIALKKEQITALLGGIKAQVREWVDNVKWTIKDKAGAWFDDLADKVGARSKFIDDTGKSLDDFGDITRSATKELSENVSLRQTWPAREFAEWYKQLAKQQEKLIDDFQATRVTADSKTIRAVENKIDKLDNSLKLQVDEFAKRYNLSEWQAFNVLEEYKIDPDFAEWILQKIKWWDDIIDFDAFWANDIQKFKDWIKAGNYDDLIEQLQKQKNRGETKKLLDFNKVGTTESALIKEAKKYKSADEFVKAQGEPLYHWWKGEITSFKLPKEWKERAVFFTNKKDVADSYIDTAKSPWKLEIEKLEDKYFSKELLEDDFIRQRDTIRNKYWQEEWKITEAFIDKNANIQKIKWVKSYNAQKQEDIIAKAKKDWYDVVVIKNTIDDALLQWDWISSDITIVLNPKVIKTQSQLKEIYTQANQ